MRRPGRQRRRRQRPPVPRAEIAAKRLKNLYQRWGSPTPPTGPEVLRLLAKADAAAVQSRQRRRQKERTAAAWRGRRARRLKRWQRGREDIGGRIWSTPTTTTKPRIQSDRRGQGMGRRGPTTSLTPAVAAVIADRLEAGDSVRMVAKDLGIPRSTVGHWIRTGRVEERAGLIIINTQ